MISDLRLVLASILWGVALVGIVGCSSPRESARDRPRCAKSARAAYQAGELVCARRMSEEVQNPVSRHEIRAYVHLKFGNLAKGISELARATELLEQRESALAREHKFQLRRLRTRLSVFRSALRYRLEESGNQQESGGQLVESDSSGGRDSSRRTEGSEGTQPNDQPSGTGQD